MDTNIIQLAPHVSQESQISTSHSEIFTGSTILSRMICRHSTAGRLGHELENRARPSLVARAFSNPYKVLQVSEDADPSQIKRAYRKLALRHHPDINEEPSAEQDFLRIQEAYEVLTHKREASQANAGSNGWDFHDWYWDFTMSHRWDSHWKKHGRSGPSPFATTPSHREQWQAQLSKLKQKAAYRRAHQQATHHPEPAGEQHDQPHWPPQRKFEPQTQAGQQHSSDQQPEHIPETDLKGSQHAVHAEVLGTEALGSQLRHDIRDWLSSQGWKEDHYEAQEVQPAVDGHAPLYQSSQHTGVQEHVRPSQMPTPSLKGQSSAGSPNFSTQAVWPENHMPADHSSVLLVVLLSHQLLQQLQQRGHSLEWAVNLNSMMVAALQHVQSTHTTFPNSGHPWGDVLPTDDSSVAAPDATATVRLLGLDSDVVPIHTEMPAAQEQTGVHEQTYACTPGNSIPALHKEDTAADDYQSKIKGPSGGSSPFQTQHTQVQSQLAGLKRRAARKHGA